MSLDLGTMYALVTLDDSDYKKKLAGLEKQSDNTFSNIAKAAAAYLSLRALGAFVQKTVGTFSDLEEETQKFSVVFAGMGERTTRVLQQLQKEFGLSELAAKRMLAGTGDMLTGFGFDRDLALTLSEGAAKLGADIASFSNYAGGAAGATSALTKAMLGEAESAKLLGVVIKQDSEEFKNLVTQAMTTGVTIKELGKQGENIIVQSEQQAKAVAALALAYQQSPNAIGDFKRSQDSIANQERILQNTFEQSVSIIGGDLSSAYRDALGLANRLLKTYNELSPQTRLLLNNTVALSAAMLALSTTKVGKSIMTFKGFSTADVDEAKAKAHEEVKRAETAKTTAELEKNLAQQNLDLAKNARAAAENAVAVAQAEQIKAQASGDAGKIAQAQSALLKAQSELTKAKLKEIQASNDLAVKQADLSVATEHYSKLSAALPGVLQSIAASATLSGKMTLFLSGGFKAAAIAAKGFLASIGPIGWAMLALGAAYTVLNALISANTRAIEENIKAAEKSANDANTLNVQLRERVQTELSAMKRLEELAQYERLSNAEKEEAAKLLKDLKIEYDETGRTIDQMISRQGKEARSLKELIAAKKEQQKIERQANLKQEIQARLKVVNARDEQRESYWEILKRTPRELRNQFAETWWTLGKIRRNDKDLPSSMKISAENAEQYAAIEKLRLEYKELQDGGVKALEDIAQKSKATRDALEKLTEKEWEIKFRAQDESGKISMIDSKIKELLPGKYAAAADYIAADRSAMSEEELKNLQKIIELENQRKQILEDTDKSFRQVIEKQQRALAEREKELADKALERSIKRAKSSGDESGVLAIMTSQLKQAQKAAKALEQSYKNVLEDAMEDEIYTAEESKFVDDLKKQWMQALSDQDKWQSRIDTEQMDKEKQASKAVGDWSVKVLAAQLGGDRSPEKETAKNTKKAWQILEEIRDQNNTGATLAYE